MNRDVSDSKLLELWKDPHFEGSFRGLNAFQTILKTNLNIFVPIKRLRELFKNEKFYLIHQRRKTVTRRHYDLNFVGELLQELKQTLIIKELINQGYSWNT